MKYKIINDLFTAFVELHEHHVAFTIYDFVEDQEISETMTALPVDKPFLTGDIKWDGCSNWDFGDAQGTTHPLHFCGQIQTKQFGELLHELYNWAAELMPEHKYINNDG